MTTDTFVKAQLALLCWRNARTMSVGPSFAMLQCMAFVERNRVRAGWHGGDWMQVIANDATYSAYESAPQGLPSPRQGELGMEIDFPDMRNDIWQRFLWEVDRVFDGTAGDPVTEGALWWAEADRINRPWFLDKIARQPEQHPRVAQCGPITLYR